MTQRKGIYAHVQEENDSRSGSGQRLKYIQNEVRVLQVSGGSGGDTFLRVVEIDVFVKRNVDIGDIYDSPGPIIRHPIFLVTFILAIVGWFVAFISMCVAESHLGESIRNARLHASKWQSLTG